MPTSLGQRLLIGASILVVLALVITAIAMTFALRHFIQGQVDGRLDGQILSIADALRIGPDGRMRLEHVVDGPPFDRHLSGWYWQAPAQNPILRSRSLAGGDFTLEGPLPAEDRPKPVPLDGSGPSDEPLRIRAKTVSIGPMVVTIATSAPLEALTGPLRDALTPLFVTMALLALALLGGLFLQVRLGLRPLGHLRTQLARVRTGRAERITGPQPSEIRPLVKELNTLLDENAANLERARRHVANLAHGLKTPLATIALALDEPGADPGQHLRSLVDTMDRRIRHHLARARVAALGGADRSHTPLAPKVADHVEVFAKLYADKALACEIDIGMNLAVACEPQDLDEMLGNLLDNAHKWARHRISVRALARNTRVDLTIEDDGPGIAAEEVANVMQPGQRIDETTPGHGFGLSITRELAELYGGALVLTSARLGGLSVVLDLPGALGEFDGAQTH